MTAPRVDALRTVGVVTAQNGEVLTMAMANRTAPLAVTWDNITVLDVRRHRGKREGALHAAKWGLGVGVILGIISLATPSPPGEDFSEPALALEAVLDGALIGALVGVLRPGQYWQRIAIPEAREAARLGAIHAVTTEPPDSEPAHAAATPELRRAAKSPLIEISAGFNFPQLATAEFPGLTAAMAINLMRHQRFGASVVAELDQSYLRAALMGGGRVYVRGAPLSRERPTLTYFAQVIAGRVRAERSGVVHSNGGMGTQPGAGVEFGTDAAAGHVQVDYRSVPGGFVDDDRITGRHIARISGMRVFVGATYRLALP